MSQAQESAPDRFCPKCGIQLLTVTVVLGIVTSASAATTLKRLARSPFYRPGVSSAADLKTLVKNRTANLKAGFIKAGKIRYWGLSNETPWGLMTVLKLADQHNLPRPVSVENAYNLINRRWENGLAEIGYRENVPLLAYSPLAFGLLSGKYLHNPKALGRVNLFAGFAQRYNKPNTKKPVAAYAILAAQHGLTPTALALAFCYQRWCVGSTIIGATTLEQLQEKGSSAECLKTLNLRPSLSVQPIFCSNPHKSLTMLNQ